MEIPDSKCKVHIRQIKPQVDYKETNMISLKYHPSSSTQPSAETPFQKPNRKASIFLMSWQVNKTR